MPDQLVVSEHFGLLALFVDPMGKARSPWEHSGAGARVPGGSPGKLVLFCGLSTSQAFPVPSARFLQSFSCRLKILAFPLVRHTLSYSLQSYATGPGRTLPYSLLFYAIAAGHTLPYSLLSYTIIPWNPFHGSQRPHPLTQEHPFL